MIGGIERVPKTGDPLKYGSFSNMYPLPTAGLPGVKNWAVERD